MEMEKELFVMLDADGVIITPHDFLSQADGNLTVDWENKVNLLTWLIAERQAGRFHRFTIVTERQAPCLAPICRLYHIDDWCVAEGGLVLYNPTSNTILVNPKFQDFLATRSQIVRRLRGKINFGPSERFQEQLGRVVSIGVTSRDRENGDFAWQEQIIDVLRDEPYFNGLAIEANNSVVIRPCGSNKYLGLE
jgi:hypothetical protein